MRLLRKIWSATVVTAKAIAKMVVSLERNPEAPRPPKTPPAKPPPPPK